MSQLEDDFAFQIAAAQLPQPVREYQFARTIGRKWRFDFAWPFYELAIELEGGVWTRGRHTRGSGFIKDCDKYNTAALMGWKVLRFTREHVDSGEALRVTEEALGKII